MRSRVLGGSNIVSTIDQNSFPARLHRLHSLILTNKIINCAAGEVEEVRDYGVLAEDANLVNPFPADDASLTRGEELYKKSCIDCHGEEGRGDALAAKNLDPHPSISALII